MTKESRLLDLRLAWQDRCARARRSVISRPEIASRLVASGQSVRRSRFGLLTMAWRNLHVRRGRTWLTLLGIALGVAVILATSITNRNAMATLDALFERTVGGCELQVTPAGGEEMVPESLLAVVAQTDGVALAVPMLSAETVPSTSLHDTTDALTASGLFEIGSSLEVVGIDPLLDPQMRVYTLTAGRFPQADEYEALIPEPLAERNDLELGDDLLLSGPGGNERLEIVGLLDCEGAATINSGQVVFAPLDVVRDVFALGSGYSEISIRTQKGIGDDPQALSELKNSLGARLAGDARVNYPAARADQVPRMASTYTLALGFFAVVAEFMGAFLIYNTFATSVVERTREIGMLRAIGMQRRQVMLQVLLEAGLLSILGCLLGLSVGTLLARGLMSLMRGFFQVEASGLGLTLGDGIKSISVGVLGTLAATLLPARQAARVSPVEALAARGRSGQRVKPVVWQAGLVLLAVGGLLLYRPASGPSQLLISVRMAAFIAFLLGAVLTVPLAITALEPYTRRLAARVFGAMGALGALNLRRSVLRTMATVASLAISLIMIIEVDSLVYVLKQDIGGWLDNAMGADLLVQAAYPMRPSFAQALEGIPGVEAISPSRAVEVQVAAETASRAADSDVGLYFVAVDPELYRQVGDKELISGQGDPDTAWELLEQGDALFVSSVVADEYGLEQGDSLVLQTGRGVHAFTIAALTNEFEEEGMVVTGTYDDLRRLYGDNRVDLFSIKVADGNDAEAVAQEIRDRYEQREGIQVVDTSSYKAQLMAHYDSLISLFDVLGLIGVVIGTLGLLNSTTMNVLERTRELGMLRAMGSQRRQVVRTVLAEAAIVGLISALYGLVFGYILSHVLVAVANLLSGYDLRYIFTLRPYLLCLAIAMGVSQLAAFAPARTASGITIALALKHE